MRIAEITSEAEIIGNYPLISQLYPEVSRADYERLVPKFIKKGYRQIGFFLEGECIGLLGFNTAIHFTCGEYLYVDDLVIDRAHRAKGYARLLLDWVEQEATRLGCATVLLDCYVESDKAQDFYKKQGYGVLAYHFCKNVGENLK